MEVIIPAAAGVGKILGAASTCGEDLRLMKYCVTVPTDDGGMLYCHLLTKELLYLEPGESVIDVNAMDVTIPDVNIPDVTIPDESVREVLAAHHFLVPADHDDRADADSVRFVLTSLGRKTDISYYTILTTTDCNARCFYCYETGRARIPMSVETADRTAEYIARNSSGRKKPLTLEWFGGEPLYNRAPIDRICGALMEKGIAYSSVIVSNGYLFDAAMIGDAVRLWKLEAAQITLDGTEEVYNRCKAYIRAETEGSPFRRVLDNIELLLRAGVRVTVRLNIGKHNAEDLPDLADELAARFGGMEGFRVYTHLLFEETGCRRMVCTDAERAELYLRERRILEKLMALGIGGWKPLPRHPRISRCMADSGNARIIFPDGSVGLCCSGEEPETIGTVFSDEEREDIIQAWRETVPAEGACADCFYYPECIRLKKCTESLRCYPETRERYRFLTEASALETYRQARKHKADTTDDREEGRRRQITEC